ncbi:hypothetical protein [Citrobacter werkmanii]|uniref:hypothetical protein n=1 Tax=Citrobacter werkmanii TaxID=67827 RepID=UPI00300C819A
MMKVLIALITILTTTQANAEYVWKSLTCGDRFIQLVDTNSTDSTYSGIIVDDVYYHEDTELSHEVEQGQVNTIMTAKNYKLRKWVTVAHLAARGVTVYVEYNINEQGGIVGEKTYGEKCY